MALALPISPSDYVAKVARPALDLLPDRMRSRQALVMLCAIALQESALAHRWQIIDRNRPQVKGPARGLLQFEQGSRASRGGVWGVYLHPSSKDHLRQLCERLGVPFDPTAIYQAIEKDDILATGVARLLLWTDPRALPSLGDESAAWDLYLRTWRPGKPHQKTWAANYAKALGAAT